MTKQEAFSYIKKFIADTWTVWEQGENDHRVGKRLDALAGRVGYDSRDLLWSLLVICLVLIAMIRYEKIERLKQEVQHLKVERDYFEREYKRLWFTRHPK